jgi:nucleotide-binding universal stress UspA family protein
MCPNSGQIEGSSMTKDVFLVAFEDKEHSERVLSYAISRAQKDGASILLAHILQWSPYTFLTPEELAERHKRRQEEMERAQTAILDGAVAKVQAAGIEVTTALRYGGVVELIAEMATGSGASMIFVGRSGSGSIAARVFGSVPIGLAQIAPVPTVIVP